MGLPGRQKWLVLALMALGMFLVAMDSTVINVALPPIREDLGYLDVSVSDLQWIVNAYLLSYAALMLTGGKLADMFGRKLMFIAGLLLFALASLGAGITDDVNQLIAARALQGVGAALVTPASLSLITVAFPPWERGMAIGIWSGIVGLGVAIGPLVGGFLAEDVDWRWVFLLNVPVGVIGVLAAFIWVKESKGAMEQRLDVPGMVTSSVALFCLVYALLKANEFGWGDARTLGLIAASVVALIAFLIVERRVRLPMLDLSLFRSPTFSGANVTGLLAGFVLLGSLFYISVFTQSIMGYTAVEAGAAALPMTVLAVAFSPVAGKLTDRVGPRWNLTGGMVLLALGQWSFVPLDFDSDFWDLVPGLLLSGIGFAFVLTPLTAAALAGVPLQQAGVGSAVVNTARQAGGALGLAVLGAISAEIIAAELLEGQPHNEGFVEAFGPIMLVAGGAAFTGALVAAFTVTKAVPAMGPPAAVPAAQPSLAGPASLVGRVSWAVPAPEAGRSLVAIAQEAAALQGGAPGVPPGPAGAPAPGPAGAPPGAAQPALLRVVTGPAEGTEIRIGAEPMTFGRAEAGTGKLGDDSELSRRHARISQQDGRLVVEDLGSTNGTRINGEVIDGPTPVDEGDAVELGSTTLKVVELPAAAPPAAAPVPAPAIASPQVTQVTAVEGPELEVVDGPATGTRIRLGYAPFVFGRAERDGGRLGDDPELSRRHASVALLDPGRLLVEDLGSTNGTFVNDLRIGAPTVAQAGDSLRVGSSTLKVVGPEVRL